MSSWSDIVKSDCKLDTRRKSDSCFSRLHCDVSVLRTVNIFVCWLLFAWFVVYVLAVEPFNVEWGEE